MAQVFHADSDFSSADQDAEYTRLGNSGERQEDDSSTKKSLLEKVKTKAKVTVRKFKDKMTKNPGEPDETSASSGQTVSLGSDDPPAPQSQSRSIQSSPPDEVKDRNDDAHGTNEEYPEDNLLNSFARSNDSVDSPFLAVPTNYNDPMATADVMPPAVIDPKSVTSEGEQSSSNLGEIPESRDEEKAAISAETHQELDPDNREGERTFDQKDLQAIDGLPKPRGFDINDEGSVKSNDFRNPESQADQTQIKGTELSVGERTVASEGLAEGERNFLPETSNDEAVETREADDGNNEKPHTPASTAEFHASMFSSNDVQTLKPNEPPAGEAHPGSGIGTLSRGIDGTEQPREQDDENEKLHPPASTAEFHDSMFTSNDIQDLEPNVPPHGESNPGSAIGTLSREVEAERNVQSSGTHGSAETPQYPPAPETELHNKMFSSALADDLKPSPTDVEDKSVTNSETTSAEPGDLSREREVGNNTVESQQLAPTGREETSAEAPTGKSNEGKSNEDDRREYDGTSVDRARFVPTAAPSDIREVEEIQAESYFDALPDEEMLARQKSVDSDLDKDFNPETTAEYHQQVKTLKEAAEHRFAVAKSGHDDDTGVTSGVDTETSQSEVSKVGADAVGLNFLGNMVQSTSSWRSAIWSAVNNLGSPTQNSCETQAPSNADTGKLKENDEGEVVKLAPSNSKSRTIDEGAQQDETFQTFHDAPELHQQLSDVTC